MEIQRLKSFKDSGKIWIDSCFSFESLTESGGKILTIYTPETNGYKEIEAKFNEQSNS